MASGTPLGQMYIELGLDVSKFSPTLNGAKNSVKYFQNNTNDLIFHLVPKDFSQYC